MPLKHDSSSLLLADLSIAQLFFYRCLTDYILSLACCLFCVSFYSNLSKLHSGKQEHIKFRIYLLKFISESLPYYRLSRNKYWSTQNYNFPCFCGCDTWSGTLMEEYRLEVIENRMLRRIFGPGRQVTDGRTIVLLIFAFQFTTTTHKTQQFSQIRGT